MDNLLTFFILNYIMTLVNLKYYIYLFKKGGKPKVYNDKYELLRSAKEQFSEILPTFAYNLIVNPLEIEEYTDNQIVLVVPQESQANLIQNTYLKQFQETFDFLTSKKCNITVLDGKMLSNYREEKKQKERSKVVEVTENYSNLNPNYTFETFVVGSNNSIAAAAAEQVAKGGITSLNPLFIYGGPGLRKNSPYASYC